MFALIRKMQILVQESNNTLIFVKSKTWDMEGATNNLGSKASTTGCMKYRTEYYEYTV